MTICCAATIACGAAAPPPAPTSTAPTTAAAAPEPDRSSPKAAAVSLFNAITAGDRDAVADSFYADTDERRALATAMADVVVSGKKLGDAAKEKFGKSGDPIGRGMLDPADLSKIDEATVIETAADAAVMTVPDQPRPMSFRKQDGQWKLVVTDFGAAAPQNVAKQTRLVRAMADAISTAAADIAADKYKTPEEAAFAIQQSLHQVMLSFYRPSTTRSATQPATTNAKAQATTTRPVSP
ncbi:MAG: hypothetical protein QOF78_353 [Phycisphaerales bacterium]|nr:hypothetical protein [Phycisphaerales bacterium]